MTLLQIIFLVAFIGGLVLAVFAMLHGVEYMRRNRSRAPSPVFNLPNVAAFAVGFGAAGYPLASRTTLPSWAVLLIAGSTGALAMLGMITLLARWALNEVTPAGMEEHAEVQGQLGLVTRDIPVASIGQISYDHLGTIIRLPARALGVRPLVTGTDIVIDRIENGVAYVEEWAVVEQRL